jgi:hypothetical protein
MLSLSVLVFSTGQKRVLKKTLKCVRKRIDFDDLAVEWLIADDFVAHPKIDNEGCRAFILKTGLFKYCYFPESNQGLGSVVNHLYQKVTTPYVLHMEHDWKFIKKVSLRPLVDIMEANEEISCIRFNKKITKAAPVVFWLDEPERTTVIQGITLTQTKSWTFNPTLYRTAHVMEALPIDNIGSEGNFKARMNGLGFKSYSLGQPRETYVKHLRGISSGRY